MKNKTILVSVLMTVLMLGTVMTAGATATDGYPCPTADGVIPTYYAGNDPQTNPNDCNPVVPEGSYRVWFTTDGTYIGGTSDIIDENGNVIGTFHYSAPYQLTTSTCEDDNVGNVGAWAFDWYVTGGYYTGIVNNKAGNGYLQYSYTNAFAEWDGDEGIYGPRTSDSISPWAGISHITFCGYFTPEDGGIQEMIDISKTAETSYTRQHFWDIDKSVDTEDDWMHDGYNKIWLYIDGSGDETATWTVDVTYEGYEDSDWAVSGEITITNSATVPIVVTSIVDTLGGTPIDVDCGCSLPVTVPAGEQLICTYSEEGYVEGSNVVDVTYYVDEDNPVTETATADIVWEDPTSVVNDVVNIQDISDLFGEVDLGTVTAPNDASFTYDKEFAWEDYGADLCGDYTYDNTATIVETEQSASATLLVNVQCYDYETAYAMGASAKCFIENGFANWGWTNLIEPGTYEMELWAAAGQCDTTKGTLVGTVTVVYDDDGYVTVTYNVVAPYILDETHVYAGYEMFPVDKKGYPTVAPGLYGYAADEMIGPFDGSEVYVIAHAVVGIPDPDFGPQPPV